VLLVVAQLLLLLVQVLALAFVLAQALQGAQPLALVPELEVVRHSQSEQSRAPDDVTL
jgi:hypothetical protein